METNRSCALLLPFLHFMALLRAGTKNITSILAFALSFCRTQAVAGGCVPPNSVRYTAVSLSPCWAGGVWMFTAAGGITISSQLPAAPWAYATVRKSEHAASHEMYQVLHVARETSSFRHSPKCAFCSVCSVPPSSRTASLAAVGGNRDCRRLWEGKLTLEMLAKEETYKEMGNK